MSIGCRTNTGAAFEAFSGVSEKMKQTILVTGGTGDIGSHTCVVLLAAGHEWVILDNLSDFARFGLVAVIQHTGRIQIDGNPVL